MSNHEKQESTSDLITRANGLTASEPETALDLYKQVLSRTAGMCSG